MPAGQEITQITSSSSQGDPPLLNHSWILLISHDDIRSLWAHWCALPPSTNSPSKQLPLLNFLLSKPPPGVFLAEITPNSPDRLVQALVVCPGVSATFTLISPATHPLHATEKDSQSVCLHIIFPPAPCSADFLGKKKYLEMLRCCPSTLAVVMLQDSGNGLPAAWH